MLVRVGSAQACLAYIFKQRSRSGVTVECGTEKYLKTLLINDAAHTITQK